MMRRLLIVLILAGVSAIGLRSAPVPKDQLRNVLIFVLDDCDDAFQGKEKYEDNLTAIDSAGKQKFRVTGLNNCQSIGSSRAIATDSKRKCVWIMENVSNRIHRFDLEGKETLTVENANGSAIAVDPETGDLWATLGGGQIGKGNTVVFDGDGKRVASFDLSGWDIVYDGKAKAFWVVDTNLSKIDASKKEVKFTIPVAVWCAVSLDVDARDGTVWVAERRHPDVNGSEDRLLKFDAEGKQLLRVALAGKSPCRVSVDPTAGSVWVAAGRAVERYSAEGKLEQTIDCKPYSLQTDPSGGSLWVATDEEVIKYTAKGEAVVKLKHASKTGMAWIAAME